MFLHDYLLGCEISMVRTLALIQQTPLEQLTDIGHHLLASERVVEAVSKLLTVPDQQLCVRRDRFDRVEVNVKVHLTSYQVLIG